MPIKVNSYISCFIKTLIIWFCGIGCGIRQPGKFQTPQPLYETLSHSNGKVVFDHGPNVIELQNTLCEPSLKQSYKI